jgi:hypothetical protein
MVYSWATVSDSLGSVFTFYEFTVTSGEDINGMSFEGRGTDNNNTGQHRDIRSHISLQGIFNSKAFD